MHQIPEPHFGFQEGVGVHAIASMAAGLATTTASSPFDVVKTTMMNHKNRFNIYICIAAQ